MSFTGTQHIWNPFLVFDSTFDQRWVQQYFLLNFTSGEICFALSSNLFQVLMQITCWFLITYLFKMTFDQWLEQNDLLFLNERRCFIKKWILSVEGKIKYTNEIAIVTYRQWSFHIFYFYWNLEIALTQSQWTF